MIYGKENKEVFTLELGDEKIYFKKLGAKAMMNISKLDQLDQPFQLIFQSACDKDGNDLGITIEQVEDLDMATVEVISIFLNELNIPKKKAN